MMYLINFLFLFNLFIVIFGETETNLIKNDGNNLRNLAAVSQNVYIFNSIQGEKSSCVFEYSVLGNPVKETAAIEYEKRLYINDVPDYQAGTFAMKNAICNDETINFPGSAISVYAPYSVMYYTYKDNFNTYSLNQVQTVSSVADLSLSWLAVIVAINIPTPNLALEFFIGDSSFNTSYNDVFKISSPNSFSIKDEKIKLCSTTGGGCLYNFNFKFSYNSVQTGETLWIIFTSDKAMSLFEDDKIIYQDNSVYTNNGYQLKSSSLLLFITTMIVIVFCALF